MADFIIHDSTDNDLIFPQEYGRGLVERDYQLYPRGCYDSVRAINFPLIDPSEYSARIKERKEQKATFRDLRRRSGPNGGIIPSLDQNGQGYCWGHSATMANMVLRMNMGLPYVRLSAFAVCCIIKNYRDEGGWGALALDFITSRGVPSVAFWPEKSMSREHDKPATWENAALHKVTEGWVDLGSSVYDRNLAARQIETLLLLGIPVIGDFAWWGHSVCLTDLEEVERGSYGYRGINSWTDGWGDQGEFVLQGSKKQTMGATAPRSTVVSYV